MTDHATESALRAQIRELETALETERASVAILRGADETAESLAVDLVKATERIAELEGRRCGECGYSDTPLDRSASRVFCRRYCRHKRQGSVCEAFARRDR